MMAVAQDEMGMWKRGTTLLTTERKCCVLNLLNGGRQKATQPAITARAMRGRNREQQRATESNRGHSNVKVQRACLLRCSGETYDCLDARPATPSQSVD